VTSRRLRGSADNGQSDYSLPAEFSELRSKYIISIAQLHSFSLSALSHIFACVHPGGICKFNEIRTLFKGVFIAFEFLGAITSIFNKI
jgi:hypothetical protein